MVAIVGGNGLGVQNSSAGLFGSSTHGAAKEAAYINAATGNLVISDRDEWLVSLGVDVALTRTYNSQGNLSSGNGANWMTGPAKRIASLNGALNTAGSTVTRIDSDGSSQLYTFDTAAGVYRSTDGAGAHDTLVGDATGWTWLGDNRDRNGVYERYDLNGRIVATGENNKDRVKYTYNGAGQLETVTDQTGDVSRYDYVNGNLAKIRTTPASGTEEVRTYYEYDTQNRLTAVVIDMSPKDRSIADGKVYRTSYQYWDSTSRVKQALQPDGRLLNFEYDDQGRVTSVTDELEGPTLFDYAIPGRTTVTEPNGDRTTYAYDALRQLTSVTKYLGSTELVTSYYYDGAGNVSRIVSPAGRATTYQYDANGNRVLERDADGRTVTRVYDQATNRLQSETTYSEVDPDGAGALTATGAMTRRYFYDSVGRPRFLLSAAGKVTEYRYNTDGQLAAELRYNRIPSEADATSESTLDAWAVRIAAAPNSIASRVDYGYDGRGQVTKATSYSAYENGVGMEDGTQTIRRYTYDQSGQLLSVTDGRNPATTYTYDELGRVLTQIEANGARKATSYDDIADLVSTGYYDVGQNNSYLSEIQRYYVLSTESKSTSQASGLARGTGDKSFAYDLNFRLRLTRDALGNTTHTLYDSAGRKSVEVIGKSMIEYVYDADGRQIGTIRYAADVDTSLLMDAGGNLLYPSLAALRPTTLPEANRRTWNNYDAGGRLTASIDANNYLTRFEYDGAGRLVRSTAFANPVDISLIADGKIPKTFPQEASSDNRVTRMFYDSDGNVVGKLDGAGYLTQLVYDAAGRLVDTITSLQSARADLRAAGSLEGLRPSANERVAHQRNIYDGKGQLVGIVDAANYLTEITYDVAGNVTRRRQYAIAVATPTATTLDKLGLQTSADDHVTSYTYNAMNQVLTETAANGDVIRYGYDNRGNQVSITRTSPTTAERTTQRRYDALGRVTSELSPEGAAKLSALGASPSANDVTSIWNAYGITYAYDKNSQRTSMTDQLGNRTLYVYDQNRLAATINAAGDWERYTYDAFGDLIEVARYTTPLTSTQMTAIATAGTVASLPTGGAALYTKYYYDNDGRKVYTANADGSVQQTVYNAFDEVSGTLQYRTPLAQVVAAIAGRGHTSGATTDLAAALGGTAASQRAYYDADGRLVFSVDANGNVENRTYSARDTVASITQYGKSGSEALSAAALAALANGGLDRTQSFTYDVRGLRTDATDAMGYRTVTSYNAFGQADKTTRYSTANGTTPSVLDAIVQTLYDSAGRVRATVNASNVLTTFSYDADGRIVEQVSYAKRFEAPPTVAQIQTALADGSLSIPADDVRQRFVYDKNGRLAATLTLQTAGSSNKWAVTSQTYDAAGRLVQRTGFATPFASSDLKPGDASIAAWIADPARATDADRATNGTVMYFYDADNRIVATATAQRGADAEREWAVVQTVYDGAGNVQQRTERVTSLKGAAPTAAQIAAMTAPTGSAYDAATFYKYDAMGRVTASAKALGANGQWALTTREYDAAGNLLSVREYATPLTNVTAATALTGTRDDVRDRLTRYSYDAGNRLVATVDTLGSAVRLEYDARGNVTKSTQFATPVTGSGKLAPNFQPTASAADRVTRTFYDQNNHPVYVIDAEGSVSFRRYDINGNVTVSIVYATELTAAEASGASSAADVAALMATRTKAADRKQYFAYYADGRLRYAIDAQGYLTGKDYDASGRVVRDLAFPLAVTLPANPTDFQILDTGAKATLAQVDHPQTRSTVYDYDAGGNLAAVADALGKTERYTYDALGRKLTFTNKLGNTWTYAYDAAGRVISETSPLVMAYADTELAKPGNWGASAQQALVTKMEYDALGNLVRRIEAYGVPGKERATQYRYDALGRQVQTILPTTTMYVYGTSENWFTDGSAPPVETDTKERSVKVTYDALGNAVSNQDVGGVTSYKIYDRAGHVRYEIDGAGYVTGYERDAFGDVTALTRYASAGTFGGRDLRAIGATDFAALVAKDASQDRTIRYTRDAKGRVLAESQPLGFTYDSHTTTGNVYQNAGRKTTFEYDAFGAVVRQAVFGADAAGNAVTDAAVTMSYYNVRGEKVAQVQALSDKPGNRSGYLTTYEYDFAGNLAGQVEFAESYSAWTATSFTGITVKPGSDRALSYEYDKLNRKKSETRKGVDFYLNGVATRSNVTTSFQYDDVGNQTKVTDALGNRAYTSYDALGHATATWQGRTAADVKTSFTEFKLDILGNVVLRVDYADGTPDGTEGNAPVVTAAMLANADNRITATHYDAAGRAVAMVDAEQFGRADAQRSVVRMSYDIYGRVARKAQFATDNWGSRHLQFEVTRYDALGRVQSVETPANGSADLNIGLYNTVRTYEYNSFGETTSITVGEKGKTGRAIEETKYDQAGRAWRTNAGDGVFKVTLHDVFGNATAQIVSTSTTANPLASLDFASQALTLTDVLRTDVRYDLLGRKVDVRRSDAVTQVLVRDARTDSWSTQPATPGANAALLLVSDSGMAAGTVNVQYRIKGSSTWLDGNGRVAAYGAYTGFNAARLPAGDYEYKVIHQPAGEAPFERIGGTFSVATSPSRDTALQLARVYAVVLNRAADLAGLNHYIAQMNGGAQLADLVLAFLDSTEGLKRFGTDTNAIANLLKDAYGRTGEAGDTGYATDLAYWSQRYEVARSQGGNARGQVILDLIATASVRMPNEAVELKARTRVENRIDAALTYALDQFGTDPKDAETVFNTALTDLAAAKAQAVTLGVTNQRSTQIAQAYLALFGRAPEQGGMNAWLTAMAAGQTMEDIVKGVLNSPEAQDPLLYPRDGLSTQQYREQLVRRVYQVMLGRAATVTEQSTWLGLMAGSSGTPAISAGGFVERLVKNVATYSGLDAAKIDERKLFNNRVAIALSFGQPRSPANGTADDQYVAKAAIDAVTSRQAADVAIKDAQVLAAANAKVAATMQAAAAAAASASPLEDTRTQLARLYVALLNRTPDSAGFDFQLGELTRGLQGAPTTARYVTLANNFINSDESIKDPTLLSNPNLTPQQFVERIYQLTLGQVPTSDGAKAEIAKFVQQLATGSRAEVALAVVNGMMRFVGMTAAEAALKARFDNKVAVSVACAINFGPFDWAGNGNVQLGREVLNRVTDGDTATAIAYAYQQAQASFRARTQQALLDAGVARNGVQSAADAATASIQANAALDSAKSAAADQTNATRQVTIMQMYVGLLGRDANAFRAKPDLDGFAMQLSYALRKPEELAQGFVDAPEGKSLYPDGMAAGDFVRKVFSTMLKGQTAPKELVDSWTAKMQGSAPLSRGQVAWGILSSFADYANYTPNKEASDYLTARDAFARRVADSFDVLTQQQQAEVALANARLEELTRIRSTIGTLSEAATNKANSQSSAVTAANKALENANLSGDGTAQRRLTITQLYATLLQRDPNSAIVQKRSLLLTEINHQLGKASLELVVQSMMESSEAGNAFATPDDTEFVKVLYRRILGREVDAQDPIALRVQDLAQRKKTRFQMALDILAGYVAYSDSRPEQLSGKAAFDTKIEQMLKAQQTEADTALSSSRATASRLRAEANAYADAKSRAEEELRIAQQKLDAAKINGGYADTILLAANATAVRKVVEAYIAIKGSASDLEIVEKTKLLGPPANLASVRLSLIKTLLAERGTAVFPTTNTAYVKALYKQILLRDAQDWEVTGRVAQLVSGQHTRESMAQDFIDSPEAQDESQKLRSKTDTRVASITATARKWNNDLEAAKLNRQTAFDKSESAGRSYAQYYPAASEKAGTADAAYLAAENLSTTMLSLAADVMPKVRTATAAVRSAVDARLAFESAESRRQILLKTEDADKAASTTANKSKDANTLARAYAGVATANARMASAYVTNANLTPAARQATQVAQLYLSVLNRAPALSEMAHWMSRLTAGMPVATIAQELMSGPDCAALYPAGMTNDQFVTQLYRFALNRGFERDPTGLTSWTDKLVGAQAMTRAELVADWIVRVPLIGNGDSNTFGTRVAATLKTMIDAGASDDLTPAIRLASQSARNAATTYDKTALAMLTATPAAVHIRPLTQLYLALLGRVPEPAGLAYQANAMANSALIPAQVANNMIASLEGQQLYPAGQSDSDFATQVLRRVLGREPQAAELSRWLPKVASGRGQAVVDIVTTYSTGTDPDTAQTVLRERFNAQVSATLASLTGAMARYAKATDQAVVRLKEIAETDNVARHTQEVVQANGVTAGSMAAFQGNQLTLDRWGNVLTITDPRDPNWKTTYTYNQAGQQTSGMATGSGGTQTALQTSRYDALGRLVGALDGRGSVNGVETLTKYVYDIAGNLAQEIHADGGVVTNTYDAFGGRLSTTQPDTNLAGGKVLIGTTTRYSYDHLGHLLATRSAAVNVYEAILTGYGPLPSNWVATQELVQRQQYDEMGRLVRSIGSDNTGTEQEYDGSGNVISTATVDLRPLEGRGVLGRTFMAYDVENHKILSEDASKRRMSWKYEDGRMTASVDMENVTTSYTYDAAGRRATQKSGRGQDLRYTYSGANLVRIDDKAIAMSTAYAYDSAGNRLRERQVYLGTAEKAPPRLQNNTLTYDSLNRITRIQDDKIALDYAYDATGNRTKITSRYDNGEPITVFNAFDVMNRQTIVNGSWIGDAATGSVVRGSGHEITYDRSGNRLTDTYNGTQVIKTSNTSYGYRTNSVTTESYTYDDAGRLDTISRDGLLIDQRRYDVGGRISQSGLTKKGDAGVSDVLTALGIDVASRVYTYDAFGHTTRSKDLNADLGTIRDIWYGAYDAMGNLTGYDVVPVKGEKAIYRVGYTYRDSYKEGTTTLAKDGSVVTSKYDVNGNRIEIFDEKDKAVRNRLWYDADGHVQSYQPNDKIAGFNLIVNGNMLGEENGSADNILGSNYMPLTNASLAAPPSSYSVQSANETLQSIAQNIWGDANLWYLIADANALTAESKLEAGTILRIPARVNTVHGDYGTYKPYDPSEQIGSTAPVMPPPSNKKGCGVVGQIIMVVVAVAVTALLTSVLGPMGTGLGGQLATLAVAGAGGSVASQAAGIAMGMQDGFNWKSVAIAALSNAVSGGISELSGSGKALSSIGGSGIPQTIARAALTNVVTQAVSVATGLQDGFKWRNVAASAVGAGVGQAASQYLNGSNAVAALFGDNKLTKATASGFAAGAASAVARGGKIEIVQVAADAFGNALGNSIAERLDPDPLGTFIDRNAATWGRVPVSEYNQPGNGYRQSSLAAYQRAATPGNVSYDNGPDENMYIVDGPAGAGAAGFDEADVKRGQPYPASGITIYEGKSVRYTTHFDTDNQGWWLETDDSQQMPAKFRNWGPSGNSVDLQRDWDARVENGTYNRWTELGNIWNSELDGLSKAKGIWQGLNYSSSTAMARWEQSRLPTQFEATFSNMVSSPFASMLGGAMMVAGAQADDVYYATTAAGVLGAGASALAGFGGQRISVLPRIAPIESGRNVGLAADLAQRGGIPSYIDLSRPENVWGLSARDLQTYFRQQGYDSKLLPPRAKSSGLAEVYRLEGHKHIEFFQRSPDTTDAGTQTTHVGQYYKFGLKNNLGEVKIIDPATYVPRTPRFDTTFFNPNGEKIIFDNGKWIRSN